MTRKLCAWDRTVDILWSRRGALAKAAGDKLNGRDFDASCERLRRENNTACDLSRYFSLPGNIRYQIMREVLRPYDSGRPIRLNSPSYFAPIWPSDPNPRWAALRLDKYFDSLGKIVDSIQSYLWVCPAMTVDVMTTLCMTRRFHVIYSPYVTESLQEAATLWMDKYGPIMKDITLEVDFTKLAGSNHPAASGLDMKVTMKRPRALVRRFAERQKIRGGTTIRNLVILARRYYGHRPTPASEIQYSLGDDDLGWQGARTIRQKLSRTPRRPSLQEFELSPRQDTHVETGGHFRTSSDTGYTVSTFSATSTSSGKDVLTPAKVPYCDDIHLRLFDPIGEIENIESLRIVGATHAYSLEIINRLGGDAKHAGLSLAEFCRYKTPSTLYPFTPGQESCHDYGPSRGVEAIKHIADSRSWREAFSNSGLKGVLFAFLSPDMIGEQCLPPSEHPALRKVHTPFDVLQDLKEAWRDGREEEMTGPRKTRSLMSLRPKVQ